MKFNETERDWPFFAKYSFGDIVRVDLGQFGQDTTIVSAPQKIIDVKEQRDDLFYKLECGAWIEEYRLISEEIIISNHIKIMVDSRPIESSCYYIEPKTGSRTNKKIKVVGNSVKVNNCTFRLIKEGDTIETVDAEKYIQYKDSFEEIINQESDEANPFDVNYPDPNELFEIKPYKAKEFFDDFMRVAVEEEDEYGTRFNVFTDSWYIFLRKASDLTNDELQHMYDNYGSAIKTIFDANNELWFMQTGND